VFGGAAALGMVTNDPQQLIVLRAVMGAGAAAIMPTTLSVITTSFPVEDRPKAIGVWVGVAGGGAVLGLFGSGLLLEFYSWNSFFGMNVALAALALIGTLAVVPTSVDEDAPQLDLVGAVLSLVAVASLVFGIIEGPDRGWDDRWTIEPLSLAGPSRSTGLSTATCQLSDIAPTLRSASRRLRRHRFPTVRAVHRGKPGGRRAPGAPLCGAFSRRRSARGPRRSRAAARRCRPIPG